MIVVFGLVFLSIVVPVWLAFHYITKWKEIRGLSREDEKMLAELWESANRMESRLNALETILDNETPGWRNRV